MPGIACRAPVTLDISTSYFIAKCALGELVPLAYITIHSYNIVLFFIKIYLIHNHQLFFTHPNVPGMVECVTDSLPDPMHA